MSIISLPDQLSKLYSDLLSRYCVFAITALNLLAITHRPFSILELSWAVTLHTARNVTTVDDLAKLVDHKKLMSMIQPFIAIQLIDKSLQDLIKKNWATKYSNTEGPHYSGDDGQRFESPEALILDICVRYLLLDEIGVEFVFSEEQIAISELPPESDLFNDEKGPVKYDFHCSWEAWEENMTRFNPAERGLGEVFVYASCYWPVFFGRVTAEGLPNLTSIEKLCQADSNRIRNWTQQNHRPGCAMPPRFPFDSQLYDPLSITCLYGSVDMMHVMLRDSDFDNGNYLEMTAMKAADQILQWGDMSRLRALFLDPRLGHQLRNLDFFRLIIRRWRESSVCRPDWEDAFALIDLIRDQMVQQQWGYELCCGAQPGNSPEYIAAARALAHELHAANAKLVYGGGTKGLMGEVAKTLVSLSGPSAVHGFIPKALVAHYPDADIGHQAEGKAQEDGKQPERMLAPGSSPAEGEYGRITIVDSMHERKQKMAKEVLAGGPGSGFVALPGGYGTLEEVAEVITWNQLGIHDRGIVLLNVNGFWDGLVMWIEMATQRGFVGQANKGIMVECKEVEEVIGVLKAYKPSGGRLNLSWGSK
ncbi:LOG family protein [Aspergillus vadensis CBS 113365]|uniref:Lysine decarboxylase-like protein n=1 Tax=Aspergillus vadensis (strain CBS 113365 / IMI 142717 / IBT 24658) TaxID=1448311 RepID=A0A319AVE3_ASPVC|nr:hypothetical protein BO88DRAFT_476240 [Aspergillus vadensis CBS 113365]PYH63544.1 hypothetical protein BO88DRAFT_476240 [Aspergillus vadensis CBS 113365]